MSFLELPNEMVKEIFKCADDGTLLKMTEVSKITSHHARSMLLNRDENTYRVKFEEMNDGLISVRFSFGKDVRSKFAFLHSFKGRFDYDSKGAYTKMTKADTVQFFNELSSKTDGINVNSLEFEPTYSMIALIEKIFKDKIVPELVFKLEQSTHAFNALKNLIRQLECTSIHVQLGQFVPADYLAELAEIVDSISLSGRSKLQDFRGGNEMDTLFIATQILARRCSYLDITQSSFTFGERITRSLLSNNLGRMHLGNKSFYFAAKIFNYVPHSDEDRRTLAARKHTVEVVKNSSDQNPHKMITSLLDLPIELAESVFQCADENSLVTMRQVSTVTKQLAKATVLNRSETPVIDRLNLCEENDGNISVHLRFDKAKLQSKLYFISAFDRHGVSEFELFPDELRALMSQNELSSLFDRLAPLVEDVQVNILQFSSLSCEMIAIMAKFLDGKTVPTLEFALDFPEELFVPMINLIRHLGSTTLRLHLTTEVYVIGHRLRFMATEVDSIIIASISERIREVKAWKSTSRLAFNVLRRRCSYFDVSETALRIEEERASSLSHVLNWTVGNKPVYFAARTVEPCHVYSVIGNRVIEVVKDTNSLNENLLEVKHFNMKRRA